jgi:hypothetical protein
VSSQPVGRDGVEALIGPADAAFAACDATALASVDATPELIPAEAPSGDVSKPFHSHSRPVEEIE